MAVRYRKDRDVWVVAIETTYGRETKHFATEQEATQYEMLQSKACLLKLHSICAQTDWINKEDSQKRKGSHAIERLGIHLHPKQVTMQMLDAYVAGRRDDGMANSTIRSELSAVKVMLTRAMRLGWLDVLPLFPEKRTLPLPEARDLVIPDQWYEECLLQLEWAECRNHRDVVIFCRRMGCRIDEALSLGWDRVDLKARQVQFVLTKGVNARRLPLSNEIFELLTRRQSRKEASAFGLKYGTFYRYYKEAIERTCGKLNLGSHVHSEWVTHTLRHTRITELANNGATAPQIQAWAGHKSMLTSQKYIHNSGVDLARLADC